MDVEKFAELSKALEKAKTELAVIESQIKQNDNLIQSVCTEFKVNNLVELTEKVNVYRIKIEEAVKKLWADAEKLGLVKE